MPTTASVNDRETDSDLVYALTQRVRELEAVLGAEWRAPRQLRLTAAEERLLGLIVEAGEISHAKVYTTLYGDRLDPPSDGVIRVTTSHLRRKLRPFGLSILVRRRRYWLNDPAALEALYGPGERPVPTET